MDNNGGPAKGYYSILQFVPDLERSEGANIGVVLFCPDKRFLKVQTATGNDRVPAIVPTETEVLNSVMQWKQRRRPPLDISIVASTIRNLGMLRWLDVEPTAGLPLPEDELVLV